MAETRASKWYHSVWFVLLMLFAVLGPFGLPLLWKSPRFNQTAKVVLTVVNIAYTGWLVLLSLSAAKAIVEHLQQIQPIIF